MAKAKVKSGKQDRIAPGHRPRRGIFKFFASRPVRRILLAALLVAVIYYQWALLASAPAIIWDAMVDVWDYLLGVFGWGLVLVAFGVAVLVWVLTAEARTVLRKWNQLFAVVALGVAIFGLLSFFESSSGIMADATFGGRFGQIVIGARDPGGVLRVVGLALLGVVLAAPRFIWQMLVGFFRLVASACRRTLSLIARACHWVLRPPLPRRAGMADGVAPPAVEVITHREEAHEGKAPAVSTPQVAVPPPGERWQGLQDAEDKLREEFEEAVPTLTASGWQLPPVSILDSLPHVDFTQADVEGKARLIEEALESYGVEARVVQTNVGPAVTQFGIEPGWDRKYKEVKERDEEGNLNVRLKEVSKTRVKVERITSLANDMALALATPSIRIEAPVPGKSVVGIEVPNTTTGLVTLRGVLESSSFQKLESRSKLAIALGRGSGGESVVADLSRMPHLLIAGATGSGKTVCLNSVIVSLLMYNTPQELQLLLIDPKRVELVSFDTVPHLASPVIVDSEKALGILRWANHEMDERYKRLADAGVRNIEGYNEKDGVDERMPYLVIAIDELADLMAYKAEEVESNICRLAQLARATGIHLVAATQRPSVDVVTGLIKANFPTRISFAVVSQVDSRAILDRGGAEKLLGRGDMLYLSTEAARPKRVQGCFVSDQEIERLVYFWGSQQVPDGRPWLIGDLAQTIGPAHDVGSPAADPLLEEARQLAREHKRISTSFLQRRLKIGYPRAARLMDLLEEEDAAGEQDEIS